MRKLRHNFLKGTWNSCSRPLARATKKLHATGEEIKNLYQKDVVLKEGVEIMENENFIRRLIYLVFHPNWQLVRGTLRPIPPACRLQPNHLFADYWEVS